MLPIHGSCPKCHHLHTNKSLRLSLNIFNHVRCRCDVCDHQMFGIGRTSTQTTLASVESISSPQRSNRNSSVLRPSSRPVCISSSAEEVRTTHLPSPDNLAPQTPLSTINESHTPGGRSPSTSNLQSPDDVSVRPEGTTISSSAGGQENSIVRQPSSSEPTGLPQPVQGERRPFSRLKNAWHRAVHSKKWRLSRTMKESPILPWRKSKRPVVPLNLPSPLGDVDHPDFAHRPSDPSDEVTSGSANTRIPSQAPTRDLASSRGDFSPEPSERILDSSTTEAENPVGGSGSTARTSGLTVREPEAGADTSQPGEPDDISHSTNAGEQMIEDAAAAIKRDRLLARRREKTLQSEIAARPLCHCHPGCHCYGVHRTSGSDVTSETARSLDSNFEPPDHSLQHLLHRVPGSTGHLPQTSIGITQLSGIGGHFDSGQHRPIPSLLTQAHRLSQATTVHNDSSSSISLPSYLGQPPSRRPGPPVQSRSPEITQLSGPPTSSTLNDQDSDSEEFRHSSEETIVDISPMSNGITAPVSIPDAPDRPQPLVRGQSASLSIQTANILTANGSPASESQTATPRPRSVNELSEGLTTSPQPEPAAIPSALQNISSTQ